MLEGYFLRDIHAATGGGMCVFMAIVNLPPNPPNITPPEIAGLIKGLSTIGFP